MTQTLASNVNNNISGVAPNDIYLNSLGNLAVSFDQQALLEACAEAARTMLGEMIFNVDQGIPYLQTAWIGVPNIPQFTAALRTAFLAVGGGRLVLEVVSLVTQQVNNQLNYNAIIRTIYGVGGING